MEAYEELLAASRLCAWDAVYDAVRQVTPRTYYETSKDAAERDAGSAVWSNGAYING